jgi:hypothetical protein
MALAGSLALAPAALAHDTYVDQGTGHDASNDCSSSAAPCKNLLRGVNQASAGDTIFVQGGHTYTGSVTLNDRKSLVAKDFVSALGPPILDNGSAGKPDISNPALAPAGHDPVAGTVKGFTIRSTTLPVQINAGMTLNDDFFDEGAPLAADVSVGGSADATISHSLFYDTTPLTGSSDKQTAIASTTSGSLKVVGNYFSGFWQGIESSGPAKAKIRANTIELSHPITGFSGGGILVLDGTAEISDNRIRNPDLAQPGAVNGIGLLTNGSIERNVIGPGFYEPIAIDNTSRPVLLASNAVYADETGVGLLVADDHSDAALDAKIRNLTAWGPGDDIEIAKAQIKMDSSIVGTGGIQTFYGSNHCEVSHSRGPKGTKNGHGCDHFSTHADPKLTAAGIHLKGGSPMIDAGNPHERGKHEHDIDGDRRVLPGCGAHKARLDIGADEYHCPKHHSTAD